MKRRSCSNWNYRKDRGEIGCILKAECKQPCYFYTHRKAGLEKPETSCRYHKYRRVDGKRLKICLKTNKEILGYCPENCKKYRRENVCSSR